MIREMLPAPHAKAGQIRPGQLAGESRIRHGQLAGTVPDPLCATGGQHSIRPVRLAGRTGSPAALDFFTAYHKNYDGSHFQGV